MKVERIVRPIVITLEDLREVRVILSALIIGDSVMTHFSPSDKVIVYNLIRALKLEGISEI